MIDGFRLTVSGLELREHFEARVQHHVKRAEWYEAQKENFAGTPHANVSNDPVEGLKSAGKRHRERASLFQFRAKHVETEERYRLSEHELRDLELTE